MEQDEKVMTFWDHLDELRSVLFRIVVVVALFTILGFCFKDQLFAVVLAPKESDFIFYRFLCRLSELLGMPGLCPGEFTSTLINTQLAGQFMMHAMVSIYAGLIVASPYIIYKLFHFISPALYENERKYSVRVVTSGYLLFIIGVLVNYFIIFPLTFRFLASYQVSLDVQNTIMLSSYIDTLMLLSLLMGIVFEIPVVCWFLAKIGVLHSSFMHKYRKHAYVVALIVAAVITPTSDVFTLLLVSVPIFVLYEASILIVRKVDKNVDD